MTTTPAAGNGRLAREIERAQRAAERRPWHRFAIEVQPGDWPDRGAADYLCVSGQVLVGDGDLPRVETFLTAEGVRYAVADALIGGVTVLRVETEVGALLDRADAALGIGVMTPNHVLDVQPVSALCPATEPQPATEEQRWPLARDEGLGAGVRVSVVDTGFLPGYEKDPALPWLRGVVGYDRDDDAYLDGRITPYGGHGTFTSGVVLSVAPGAEVTVDDVLVGGVVDEAALVRQLVDALAGSPDLISVQAGTYTRHNVPPKALAAFWDQRLRHHAGVAVVAAAGNDGGRQPFWPAAFPWAMAVGALTRGGDRRAPWSNHGGWVDVYAPGEDVVNAFPHGTYTYLDRSEKEFPHRMARWSGTSFATPVVAGLVARRMAQTGENGWEAAAALRRTAQQQFLPGVGPRLLP